MLPILISVAEDPSEPGWIFDTNYQEKPKEDLRSPKLMGQDAYWEGKELHNNPFNHLLRPEDWNLWNIGWIESSNLF